MATMKNSSRRRSADTRPRAGTRRRVSRVITQDQPDSDIPFVIPAQLTPGVHVAPFLSWTGEPLLLVINGRGEEELVVRLTGVRALEHRKGQVEYPFVTPQWLGNMTRPWQRGVWRSPFTVRGGRQYLAVDAHGRLVAVKWLRLDGVAASVFDPQNEAEAVAACRAALRAEDPVVRPRPRGESRC